MAKTEKSTKGLTIKEETLNDIVKAQKEKIVALTNYGKKLKKELKDCSDAAEENCDELIISFNEETIKLVKSYNKTLIGVAISSFILGLVIGFIL